MSETVHIGFTGTKEPLTVEQASALEELLIEYGQDNPICLHHGDCVGADALAHKFARKLGFRVVIHPPTNPRFRAWCDGDEWREPAEYLTRNQQIVDSVEELIACPVQRVEQRRSGTWATVRRARKARVPVTFVYPDGTVNLEPVQTSA